MKQLLFTICFFVALSINAQDSLLLKLDNYCPRVGDKIELSFSFDFFDDLIKEQLEEDIEITEKNDYSSSRDNVFTRNISFTQPGNKTVGPFRFNFNGKEYVTNAIKVEVAEKLPFKEGAWVRMGTDESGNKVLVLEQYTKLVTESKQTRDGFYSSTHSSLEDDEYAEIKNIDEDGIEIRFRTSIRKSRSEDGESLMGDMYYSRSIYKVILDEDFSGTFVLKKKHYRNLPRGAKIDKIEITR